MALNINGTTGISGVDGSVSAPALTGTDSNTGITFPSADTIKLSTAGVERMQISNDGVSASGHIIQVVSVSSNAIRSTTSTSYVEVTSDLRATIVPKNANNLILITVHFGNVSPTGNNVASFRILKDGTDLVEAPLESTSNESANIQCWTGNEHMTPASITVKELAGNTSSRYYSPFFRTNASTIHVNSYRISPAYRSTSNITVMEVAA
mgnify:CR=1 FL=1|tara:strand:+ start:627 stop:1253 length:627 start_codon:yes stop_codon:yes gene_type:complete